MDAPSNNPQSADLSQFHSSSHPSEPNKLQKNVHKLTPGSLNKITEEISSSQPTTSKFSTYEKRIRDLEAANRNLSQQNKESRIAELEKHVSILSSENEKLADLVVSYSKQVGQSQTTDQKSKEKVQQEEDESRIELFAAEIERLNHLLNSSKVECESWSKRYNIEKEKNRGLDTSINELLLENEGLKEWIENNSGEVEAWKKKCYEVQQHLSILQVKQNKFFEGSNRDSIFGDPKNAQKLMDKLIKLETLEETAADYDKKIELVVNETLRLNEIVEEAKSEARQWQARCLDYEVSYKEKEELQKRFNLLLCEKKRLEDNCTEYQKEIEAWKGRALELERGNRGIEKSKDKKVESDEVLNLRIRDLSQENNRLNTYVSDKVKEIEKMKQKIEEADKLCDENRELEAKIEIIIEDNERLNKLALDYVSNAKEWKRKYHEQETSRLKQQGSDLNGQTTRKETDRQDITGEDKPTLQSDNDKKVKEYFYQIKELEEVIKLFTAEKDDYSRRLIEKTKEAKEWQEKYKDTEQKTLAIREFEGKISTLVRENGTLSQTLKEKMEEVLELKESWSVMEKENLEVQANMALIIKENEYLNGLLGEARTEIVRLMHIIEDAEEMKSNRKMVDEGAAGIMKENEALKNVVVERMKEIEQMRQRIVAFERNSDTMESANLKLQTLNVEKERLEIINSDLRKEVEVWTKRYSMINDNQIALVELEKKFETLATENEHLNSIITTNLKDIELQRKELEGYDKVKRELSDSEIKIDFLNAEKTRLINEFRDKNRENEKLKMRIKEVEEHHNGIEDMDNKVSLLVGEIERLNDMINEKNIEIDMLKTRGGDLKAVKEQNVSLNERNENLSKELKGLMEKVKLVERQEKESKKKIEDLVRENLTLKEAEKELENCKSYLEKLENAMVQLEKLKENSMMMTQKIKELDVALLASTSENEGWKEKYNQLELSHNELEGLSIKFTELQSAYIDMKRILDEKTRENYDLNENLCELERQIFAVVIENERLLEEMNKKGMQIELWKGLEVDARQMQEAFREVELKLKTALEESEKLKEALLEREKEAEILKAKMLDTLPSDISTAKNRVIQSQETRFVMLCVEIERLTNELEKEKKHKKSERYNREIQEQANIE